MSGNHREIVLLLLQNGADPYYQHWWLIDEKNALSWACRKGHADIVRMLLQDDRITVDTVTLCQMFFKPELRRHIFTYLGLIVWKFAKRIPPV